MKSLTLLWLCMADDLAMRCLTSAALDFKKLESRVEAEGLSFLTITLPSFGKDFERCLEGGSVDSTAFAGFQRRGGLPLFLGGFLSRIFNTSSGDLLDEPCLDSIFAIRQLAGVFKKILLPCSDARVEGAFREFIKCEQEIGMTGDLEALRHASLVLFAPVLSLADRAVYEGSLIPKHGPGATADKLKGNQKFDQTEWPERLEAVFPFGDYAVANRRYYYHHDSMDLLEPGNDRSIIPAVSDFEQGGKRSRAVFLASEEERSVQITPVPKTLKTPRLIAIEPTCMQYMQQAISLELVKSLESSVLRNGDPNLACGFVGFTDQMPNRQMAMQGSKSQTFATIDLHEASDRVLTEHVDSLLSNFPHLRAGVMATRSTKALVPLKTGDVTVRLKKFASMGSALTFPMEAMVFLAVAFIGIAKAQNQPLTRNFVKKYRGQVRVYGDDIIVPTDCVSSVLHELEAYGFRPNMNKTFWNGKFRESCGGDYYDGVDVSIARLGRVIPSSRTDASEVISLVAFRNLSYERGLWKTAGWCDNLLKKILGHFPIVEPTSSGLGRLSYAFPYEEERTHSDYHSPRVKAWKVISRPPPSGVSGEGALLKFLLKQGSEPFADANHLERQGRPLVVDIKPRWVQPF